MAPAVVLVTRTLRVHDHPALVEAVAASDGEVVPLFVVDDELVRRRGAPNRLGFLVESLHDLRCCLRGLGSDLVVRRGDPATATAELVAEVGAGSVHLTGDTSEWSRRRRAGLGRAVGRDVELVVHPGITVVRPGALQPSGGGDHYRVFTPYWRRWAATGWGRPEPPPDRLRPLPRSLVTGEIPDASELAGTSPSPDAVSPGRSSGGEAAARERWDAWQAAWDHERAGEQESLSDPGGTRLSAALHFGCISAREIATTATRLGAEELVRQLCWRDFMHQVAWAFPAIAARPYRDRGRRWHGDGPDADAWRAGTTGVPVVDAGMRQLRVEGWMPNRARMICASFLVKQLGVDWRIGADHFWTWLVDADLANNHGSWQWVAGTGNDTRPNRRLDPLRQADRFDPDGDYVRRWIPELRHVDGGAVHRPWEFDPPTAGTAPYPPPLADLV